MTADLRVLTLRQPHAWAVAAGHKRIENRSWHPPPGVSRILVHAGQGWEPDAVEGIGARLGLRVGDDLGPACAVPGQLVALVRIAGCCHDPSELPEAVRPWYSGPHGWELTDVRRLDPPIPWRKGKLGLWRPGPELLAALRAAGIDVDRMTATEHPARLDVGQGTLFHRMQEGRMDYQIVEHEGRYAVARWNEAHAQWQVTPQWMTAEGRRETGIVLAVARTDRGIVTDPAVRTWTTRKAAEKALEAYHATIRAEEAAEQLDFPVGQDVGDAGRDDE